ncbi:LysM peptidoglycan-binding domain-containing protein, partial [bacterium]|nr:LysM peptidoglycan-binding domain-containing protein [bacterium]
VADWAQRHVWAAVVGSIGCASMILMMVALLVVRGVLSLSGEYEEADPISPLPVEAAAPAADPSLLASGEREYRVRRNDTLSDIAAKHGVALIALRERNAVTLEAWRTQYLKNARIQPGACPDVVFRGGKLIIPAPQAISPK